MDAFDGFADFMRVHGVALSRLAYLLTGDHADAQDLVQSALTKTAVQWRRVSRYDEPLAFVKRVMMNETISVWRRRKRIRVDAVGQVPDRPGHENEGDALRRMLMWQALGKLSVRQRAVLVLRFYEDRSVAETAEMLGCSTGTVKSQTYDALERMRALVPDFAETEVL